MMNNNNKSLFFETEKNVIKNVPFNIEKIIKYRKLLCFHFGMENLLPGSITVNNPNKNEETSVLWLKLLRIYLYICENLAVTNEFNNIVGLKTFPLFVGNRINDEQYRSNNNNNDEFESITGRGRKKKNQRHYILESDSETDDSSDNEDDIFMEDDDDNEFNDVFELENVENENEIMYEKVISDLPPTHGINKGDEKSEMYIEVIYKSGHDNHSFGNKMEIIDLLIILLEDSITDTDKNMGLLESLLGIAKYYTDEYEYRKVRETIQIIKNQPSMDEVMNFVEELKKYRRERKYNNISDLIKYRDVESLNFYFFSKTTYDPNFFLAELLDKNQLEVFKKTDVNSLSNNLLNFISMINTNKHALTVMTEEEISEVEENEENIVSNNNNNNKKKKGKQKKSDKISLLDRNQKQEKRQNDISKDYGTLNIEIFKNLYNLYTGCNFFNLTNTNRYKKLKDSPFLNVSNFFSHDNLLEIRNQDNLLQKQTYDFNIENGNQYTNKYRYDSDGFMHFRFPYSRGLMKIPTNEINLVNITHKELEILNKKIPNPIIHALPEEFEIQKKLRLNVKRTDKFNKNKEKMKNNNNNSNEENRKKMILQNLKLKKKRKSLIEQGYSSAEADKIIEELNPYTNPIDLNDVVSSDNSYQFDFRSSNYIKSSGKFGKNENDDNMEDGLYSASQDFFDGIKKITEEVRYWLNNNIKDKKRIRSLMLQHYLWAFKQYRKIRNPQLKNPSSVVETFKKIVDEDIYDPEKSLEINNIFNNLDPFANFLLLCKSHFSNVENCVDAIQATLLYINSMDSTRSDRKNRVSHMGIQGEGAQQKSFNLDIVNDTRIKETSTVYTRMTNCALDIAKDRYDKSLLINHECPRTEFISNEEDGGASGKFKNFIEKGEIKTISNVQDANGQRKHEETKAIVRSVHYFALNWSIYLLEKSIKQRILFLRKLIKINGNDSVGAKMTQQAFNDMFKTSWIKKDQRQRFFHQYQCFLTEANIFIDSLFEEVNTIFARILINYISKHIEERLGFGFDPRFIQRIIRYAIQILLTDYWFSNYCLKGGMFYNKRFEPEQLIYLDAFLVLKPQHIIHSVGFLSKYYFISGIQQFTLALKLNLQQRLINIRKYKSPIDAEKYIKDTFSVNSRFYKEQKQQEYQNRKVRFEKQKNMFNNNNNNEEDDRVDNCLNNAHYDTSHVNNFNDPHDFNYVFIPLQGSDPKAQIKNFAGKLYSNILSCKDIKETPNIDGIFDIIMELASKTIYSKPYKLNEDYMDMISNCDDPNQLDLDDLYGEDIVIEDDEAESKKAFRAIVQLNRGLLIHSSLIYNNPLSDDIVVEALEKFFDYSNQPVKNYIYSEKNGNYNFIRLGSKNPNNSKTMRHLIIDNPSFIDDNERYFLFDDNMNNDNIVYQCKNMILDQSYEENAIYTRYKQLGITSDIITDRHLNESCSMLKYWHEDNYDTITDKTLFVHRFDKKIEKETYGMIDDFDDLGITVSVSNDDNSLMDDDYSYGSSSSSSSSSKTPVEYTDFEMTNKLEVEDVIFDYDLNPNDHLIPNPNYNPYSDSNVLNNPEYIPIWKLIGISRDEYKLIYTSSEILKIKHKIAYGKSKEYKCNLINSPVNTEKKIQPRFEGYNISAFTDYKNDVLKRLEERDKVISETLDKLRNTLTTRNYSNPMNKKLSHKLK